MAGYVADFRDELGRIGPDKFVQTHPHPVLVVLGLAGTLRPQGGGGRTVVADNSEVLLLGALVGRVFPVAKGKYAPPGPVVIGRTNDNDVSIPEYSISTRHCTLTLTGREVRLCDCGSTNGTFVNGARLEPNRPMPLAGGEKLQLGRFALLFQHPRGFVEYLQQRT